MSETNAKGDIGEAAFVFAAAKRGYWVCPAPQDCPYDFVMDKRDGNLVRVQVKYRSASKTGSILIKRVIHKEHCNANRRSYDSDNVDAFAVYVPDTDQVYMIPVTQFEEVEEATFRVFPSKNKQTRGIRVLEDFLVW